MAQELARNIADVRSVVILTARMDEDFYRQERSFPNVTWVQRPFRLLKLLDAVRSTEQVPRDSWRCLETLPGESTKPVNGVLFDSHATTRDPASQLTSGLCDK